MHNPRIFPVTPLILYVLIAYSMDVGMRTRGREDGGRTMNGIQIMKADTELRQAVLEAIIKAAKAGLDSERIAAILEDMKDAIEANDVE